MAGLDSSVEQVKSLAEAKGLHAVRVTWVHHWTSELFSFRVERPQTLRFHSGEFIMVGLPGDAGKPLLRAYSIVSPSWADHLEFFSVKVPPWAAHLTAAAPGGWR